jgi:multidrug efflux pump subunit AcrA (membrane-fusion protein)
MRINTRNLLKTIALGMVGLCAFQSLQAAGPNSPDIIDRGCFTAPSERAKLQFNSMGLVKEVPVKEGDAVKKGDLLMKQDTDIDQAEYDRTKREADSQARIDFYRSDLKVKQAKLARMTNNADVMKAYNASEIEEAEADVEKGMKQIEVAELDHNGDVVKSIQQKFKLDKMVLLSPFDGKIEDIGTHEGELATMDKDKPAITIVKNDPCDVVINTLTTAQVAKLVKGDVFEVRYSDETQWRQAKVKFIAPVADAGSDTHPIKLELANPEGRNTGQQVQVKLPAKIVPSSGGLNAAMGR